VEPAAYSLPGVTRRWLTGRRPLSLRARVRHESEGLLVFTPAATLPGSLHVRAVNRIVHRLAWRALRRRLPGLEPGRVDVVVGWPPALDLACWLRPRRLIYDCLDLFPAFQDGRRGRLLASIETELGAAAWGVVTTSRDLERRWQGRHHRVVRIPNGVEGARFLSGPEAPPAPPEVASLPRPRLGYTGTVGRWIDFPLLAALATRRPDWSIVMVGPVEPGVEVPAGCPNLHLLGEQPYAALPAYLAAMDVLLIPFRLTDLTRAVNPIKLYEYCASGKPIAATPLDEVVAAGEVCHLGQGADGFARAVEAALHEAETSDRTRSVARQALARASDWDERVAAFTELLDRDAPPAGAEDGGPLIAGG